MCSASSTMAYGEQKMLNRKVFKIINVDNHILGFCWAKSSEEAKKVFCDQIAPPLGVIDVYWKTQAYFLAFNGALDVKEYQNYKVEITAPDSPLIFLDDDPFDDTDIYARINFVPHDVCFIRIIKLYKTGDKCPKGGGMAWF